MKGFSTLKVTTSLMVILLLLDVTLTHASPTDRWLSGEVDDGLVQRVARNLLEQMTEFQRIRRTGLSARHKALSNYLKMKNLSSKINNPFGPGRRK